MAGKKDFDDGDANVSAGVPLKKEVVGVCPQCGGNIVQVIVRRYSPYTVYDPETDKTTVVSRFIEKSIGFPTCEKCKIELKENDPEKEKNRA